MQSCIDWSLNFDTKYVMYVLYEHVDDKNSEYFTRHTDVLVTDYREFDEIIADHKAENDDDCSQSDEDDSEVQLLPIPTRNDVLDAISLLRRYLTAAPTDTEQVDRSVNQIENFVVSSSLASLRQLQITEFFS